MSIVRDLCMALWYFVLGCFYWVRNLILGRPDNGLS